MPERRGDAIDWAEEHFRASPPRYFIAACTDVAAILVIVIGPLPALVPCGAESSAAV